MLRLSASIPDEYTRNPAGRTAFPPQTYPGKTCGRRHPQRDP